MLQAELRERELAAKRLRREALAAAVHENRQSRVAQAAARSAALRSTEVAVSSRRHKRLQAVADAARQQVKHAVVVAGAAKEKEREAAARAGTALDDKIGAAGVRRALFLEARSPAAALESSGARVRRELASREADAAERAVKLAHKLELAGAKREAHITRTREKAAHEVAHAFEVARTAAADGSQVQAALRRSIFERANSADFRRQMRQMLQALPRAAAAGSSAKSPRGALSHASSSGAEAHPTCTPTADAPASPGATAAGSPGATAAIPGATAGGPTTADIVGVSPVRSAFTQNAPQNAPQTRGYIVWLGPDGGAGRVRPSAPRPSAPVTPVPELVVVPLGYGEPDAGGKGGAQAAMKTPAARLPPTHLLLRLMVRPRFQTATAAARQAGAAARRAISLSVASALFQRRAALAAMAAGRRAARTELAKLRHETRMASAIKRRDAALAVRTDKARSMGSAAVIGAAARRARGHMVLIERSIEKEVGRLAADRRRVVAVVSESIWRKAKWAAAAARRDAQDRARARRTAAWVCREAAAATRRQMLLQRRTGKRVTAGPSPLVRSTYAKAAGATWPAGADTAGAADAARADKTGGVPVTLTISAAAAPLCVVLRIDTSPPPPAAAAAPPMLVPPPAAAAVTMPPPPMPTPANSFNWDELSAASRLDARVAAQNEAKEREDAVRAKWVALAALSATRAADDKEVGEAGAAEAEEAEEVEVEERTKAAVEGEAAVVVDAPSLSAARPVEHEAWVVV